MKQREANNIIIIFILTIAIHDVSSSQNLNITTINIDSNGGDKVTDHASLQPLNTTTIYQDSTTYLPTSTSIEAEEILDSSETKNVLNRYAQPIYQHNEHIKKNNNPEEPPDDPIPYSEHEDAKDVPTKPKYVAPGIWAKPPPEKNISLNFVPTKLHAQVRGSHTVKRLPQQQAIESAETDEERRNAPRLKAIVSNTKINTIYTEEGYEDSAYDHAGHIRDADFHEGFARKLHDRKKSEQNSSSNKKKKENSKNLMPDEFKEYEDDYQDHLQESRKFEEVDKNNLIEYDGNSWKNSEIDPKFVAKNNIHKLIDDVEKHAEEAERNAKIYQNAQESKPRNDIKVDSSELENEDDHVEDNIKLEDKFIKTKKESKLQKNDNVSKKSKQLEEKQELPKNYETTAFLLEETNLTDVKTPVINHNFIKNSPNSQIHSIDQTTLHYVVPTTSSFRQVDEPTTISYSQLFWDYFKAKQDRSITESSTLIPNTTMNPQVTPIAVATIDGHGPYLLVTKEEIVTSPSTFFKDEFSHNFDSRDLFSDHVEFNPPSTQMHGRHLLEQSDSVDYVNNMITTSTVATFTSVQSLPSLSPESVEYSSSTTLLDTTMSSSTPAIMTLNFTQEAVARIADYHENPFLGPILDNSNIAVTKKLKYKVLARAKPSHEKKAIKSVTQSSNQQVAPSSFKENEYKRIQDKLNAEYNKMLSYNKNKQEIQSFPKEEKVVFTKAVIPRKPPIQQTAYSIFLTNHPSNHLSVSTESESSQERKLQNQHRSQPIKLPFRFDPFDHIYLRPVYHKNSLPASKLLPPPPLPFINAYANYRSNKQNDYYFYPNSKPQHRLDAFRYFPLNSEASWRTQLRRKRSNEDEFHDADVNVKVANNNMTSDYKSEQQDKSLFNKVIDRSEEKSSNQKEIYAPIDIPDAMKLIISESSREDENGTSNNKNNTVRSILIQSAKKNERINDTDVVELTKKRDVGNKTYLTRSLKNKENEEDYEQLLNESPKISGDVINREIATRFNKNNNEISSKKNGKIEIEIPSFPYVEELAEDDLEKSSTTTEVTIDSKKYPFYNNENVPSASALKYIVDPRTVPRKTLRGMEFYNSRNAYKQCDEVEPNLDKILPEKEEPDPERGPQGDLPRLRGLGNKLDCFKAKYFDENPLDNPLFAEKLVEEPTPPTELNPMKFASKIMILPKENDEYVVPQVSKKPERFGRQWRNRIHPYETFKSIRINYKHDPQTGKGRNAYFHTVRDMRPSSNMIRRMKNRKPRPKIFTTTESSALYQTASYQNQVYEDVMGNIRNLKNTYQVYEITTLPPSKQILATAGSENMLKVANNVSNSSKEKSTSKPDVTNVMNNTKSSEIKGLVPPPKYFNQRQNYRQHRPLTKNRIALVRTTFPRIPFIAHTIKINKRSTNDMNATAKNSSKDMKKTTVKVRNFSENVINKNKNVTVNGSIEIMAIRNDTSKKLIEGVMDKTNTSVKLIEGPMNKTNTASKPLDLEIEESRPINTLDRNLSTTLKIDDKKKRRNSTSSDLRNEPRKTVYTIRDRIRYSKPKWDMRGFEKFTTSSQTIDEDGRRKEPRYNRIERKKKPVDDLDRHNNYVIINSTESTSGIESTTSLIEDRESSTTEAYYAEESAMQQKKAEYQEPEKAENTESEESFFSENEEKSTTNTYQVHENIDEDVSTTMTNPQSSKEVLDLREYLESEPPGYAETFSEEATTLPSKNRANHESKDSKEKQEEETDYPGVVANSWDDENSEKIEEQVETPVKTKSGQDENSEELSSKEEEGSNEDQIYTRRPLIESDKDDEVSEKTTFYKPFPFSKYESKIKKESEEDDPEEESEEKSEDYVFPWHADKKIKEEKWFHNINRYEYPWERRERLARERKKQKQGKEQFFDDEDGEESIRLERPIYPWEMYNVPSKNHRVNNRRDISRKDDEKSIENVPFIKYSSRYRSSGAPPSNFTNAHEISRSIKKLLEDDKSEGKTSKEIENPSPTLAQKLSSPSEKGISRGTLVPEDITQPSREKNARRISKVDKNMSSNSRFDLRNKDEKKEEPVEYLKLNKSNLNEAESPSSQPSTLANGTKEVLSATGQREKRRRRILKNNSTITVDNAPAESVAKSTKKRRRKPVVSTTTSTTPSASIDFSTKKSDFAPVRRRYSKNKKTNRSDFSKKTAAAKTIATPETIKTDFPVETSTPKTRTIEHLSRVSKEKIVTKTTYPDKTENFDSIKNVTSALRKPVKLRIKSRRKKSNNNNEDSHNRRELIKQKNKGDYKVKFVNEDKTKKSVILDKPQEKNRDNAFENFGTKKEEVKKINDFGIYDGIVNDENDNGDFRISSEVNLSPQHETVQLTKYGSRHIMSSMSWILKNYDY